MIDRIHAFRAALQDAAAEQRVPAKHGVGLFAPSVREVYDMNYMRAEQPAPPDELIADAERLMEDYFHKRVILERADGNTATGFRAHGWTVVPHLIMARTREPDRLVDTSVVREVPFAELTAARREVTAGEPWGDDEISSLLDDAKQLIVRAVPTRFFAAFADGEIAAYCEARSNGTVAQIEDVNTLPRFRGRGLGRAVVQHATDEARKTNEIVFLEALAEDWPRELYTKLGFDVVGERHFNTLFPHPMTRLRVRTPRLELRLATRAELRALGELAQRGIHDPADMPFGVAWTDDSDRPGFVDEAIEHHEAATREWQPTDWSLNLIAFHRGRPAGVQSIRGERFGERLTVDTGSWLGREFQGHGLGTEMRAAALSLAFEGLGATVATSGAIEGNPQSLAVSRKLGYEIVGAHTVSPRGVPVEHTDLELRRESFRSPVPVELVALEPLLPLFGAA
ncbi:MAG: putative succinyl-CoA transferase [Actinomycetia bacterium]|nr:putative succinyl-CoA transferase [Actinomycetes bacterium]